MFGIRQESIGNDFTSIQLFNGTHKLVPTGLRHFPHYFLFLMIPAVPQNGHQLTLATI